MRSTCQPGSDRLRGAIAVLGGPVTRGFVTGERIAPADNPDLEVSLQALGAEVPAILDGMDAVDDV